ncbi:MAG: hypothetical protein JWQ62_1029, partial [Lacunisphaera sp.]|nr:hypothetical protein [Lacunisphaera sp.]
TCTAGLTLANMKDVVLKNINVTGFTGALLGTVNVTGTGLDGASPIPAPVDPPAGNAAGTAAGGSGARTALWNGTDLTGWSFSLNDASIDPKTVWKATDGVLSLATKASGYIKTGKTFSNYHLHVEWRWPKDAPANTNSGVMVHVHGPDVVWPLCFECQLKTGNAGQVVGMGLDIPDAPMDNKRKRAPKFAASSEKPLGEWNSYEILCRNDTIEVFINGVRQNQVGKLPVSAGQIALQMEGFPIEFRNVWVENL